MSTRENCRKQIRRLRDAIIGIEAAYVARPRLRRLILACSRMVAREYGMREPVLPGPFELPPNPSQRIQNIAVCCSRLLECAEILCQPSEPLDARWRNNWATVLGDLVILEKLMADAGD